MSEHDGKQDPATPGGQGGDAPGRRLADEGEALARDLWVEVRAGAHHFHLRDRRPPTGRIRQFFHGMSLPFHLARALLAAPQARGRYLRVGLLQTLAALLLVTVYMGPCGKAHEVMSEEAQKEARAQAKERRRAQKAQAAADQALREAGGPPLAPPAPLSPEELAKEDPFEDAPPHLQEKLREVEAAAQGRDAGVSLPEAIAALMVEAVQHADEEEAASGPDGGTAVAAPDKPPREGGGNKVSFGESSWLQVDWEEPVWKAKERSWWNLAFWALLFGALQVAQWVVIALSRQYHDAISRDASLLTGVEPEDEELTPRVCVDFAWMRKKVQRRWRAFVLFAVGMPVLWLFTVPLFCSSTVLSVLTTAWAAWWLVVFTAAKSSRAWEAPLKTPRPPWFLRGWTWLTTRVPGFRWGPLQRYGAFLTRRTQEVMAPIATTERHPWAFAGLTLVRFIATFPPMKFFLRPLIPVASAHLLAVEAAERAALVPAPPKPMIPAGETGA